MTANIKTPVATAENVQAVPLAAVFTEKNPDTGLMERYVYVQKGDSFEKRNMKVGVFNYFFVEIQEGLAAGEIVSLEQPTDLKAKDARPPDRKRALSITTPLVRATGNQTDQRIL